MAKKILVIPDSFKDSISSKEFCNIAKSSLLKINPSAIVDCIPMGDGGEGSMTEGGGGDYSTPSHPTLFKHSFSQAVVVSTPLHSTPPHSIQTYQMVATPLNLSISSSIDRFIHSVTH